MHSSLLFLASLIPALTLAAPLEARAVTKPKILSLSPSGSGCINSTTYQKTISPDGWTATVGYITFITDDVAGPRECTVAVAYEVVIPSDGKADLDLEVYAVGAVSGNAELPNDTVGHLKQTVSYDGKTISSNIDLKAETRGQTRVNPKWTVNGAAGSTVSGSISINVQPTITGGRPGENFADLQVENTVVNFLPRPN